MQNWNDIQKAIDLYNSILEQNPGDEVALGQLMDIYYDTDKFKYYLTRANLNSVQGLFEHSANDLKKALLIDATHAPARFMLASIYEREGKNLKAIDEYLRILDTNPDENEVYKRLSNLYIIEGSYEGAVEILTRGLNQVDDDEMSDGLAKIYFHMSEYDKALEYAKSHFLRAKMLLQKGENEAALEEINKLSKGAPYYSLMAEYHYNKCEYDECLKNVDLYQQKGGDNAVIYQMKALVAAARDDDAKSHYYWGVCRMVRGRLEEALNEFLQSYQLEPNEKSTLEKIAQIYMDLDEQYPAMEFWEKVYNIDRDKHAAKILIDFYLKHGDYDAAAKYGFKKEENVEADEGLLNKLLGFFKKK